MAKKRENVTKRNINLDIKTYERLEKYKVKLIGEKGDSRITFDNVINNLLDNKRALLES